MEYGNRMVRVTFSLPEATVQELKHTARRLGIAQSHVVRDSIAEYSARTGRLPERERFRMLDVIRRWKRNAGTRRAGTVESEIEEVRAARRLSSRRRA